MRAHQACLPCTTSVKVGIPDAILHKPGKLTPEEWEIMKTHAQLGQDMLSGSDLALFQIGATIAGQPSREVEWQRLSPRIEGEDIPLEGRIVALADVFDALGRIVATSRPGR